MSMAMAANPAGTARAASVRPDPQRATGEESANEAVLSFVDALDGLAAALTGFDVAGAQSVAGDSQALDASDDKSATETSAQTVLDVPLAILTNLPAMAAVLPAAMALPALAAVAAELDIGSGEPAAVATAGVATAPAGLAASLLSLAQAAGPASLPAAVAPNDGATDPAGQNASRPHPAEAAVSRSQTSVEGLQAKLKMEAGTAETQADAAPTAPVADVAPTLATAPAREAAGGAGITSAVKLPATQPEQWRQPLMEALGERIRVSVGKHSEQAVIRLDPPMLGSVEIILRHQGGALQVQLSASHDEVVRQLQQIGDSLRQDLTRNQYTDVSVQVFAGSRDGDGRQHADGRPDERQPGRALADAEDDGEKPSAFVFSSNEY